MQEVAALKQIKIYNILRSKEGIFTDEEAQYIAASLNQKDDVATKEDIALVGKDIVRLEGKMKLWFLLTLLVILVTNPKALELIQKLCGVIGKL